MPVSMSEFPLSERYQCAAEFIRLFAPEFDTKPGLGFSFPTYGTNPICISVARDNVPSGVFHRLCKIFGKQEDSENGRGPWKLEIYEPWAGEKNLRGEAEIRMFGRLVSFRLTIHGAFICTPKRYEEKVIVRDLESEDLLNITKQIDELQEALKTGQRMSKSRECVEFDCTPVGPKE
jgi:hypothetical protein